VEGIVCLSQCVVVLEVQHTLNMLKSSELYLLKKGYKTAPY
jgi:hypothetical protein